MFDLMNGLRIVCVGLIGTINLSAFGQCDCDCPDGEGFDKAGTVMVLYESEISSDDYTCTANASGSVEICTKCLGGAVATYSFTGECPPMLTNPWDTECNTVFIGASETSTPGRFTISMTSPCPNGPTFSGTVGTGVVFSEGESGSGSCTSVTYTLDSSTEGITNTQTISVTVSPSTCVELVEAAPGSCPVPVDEGGGGDDDDDGCGNLDETLDPVHNIKGTKIERNTDLVVPLPGRDFKLIREYNSDPNYYQVNSSGESYWNGVMGLTRPGYVGAQWGLNVMRFIFGGDINGNTPEDLYVAGYPTNTIRQFALKPNGVPNYPVYTAVGSANQIITQETLDSAKDIHFGGVPLEIYRLSRPGGMTTDYVKVQLGFNPSVPNIDFGPEDLHGRIIREQDEYGNEWFYEWFALTNSATSYRESPRIKSIYFNGTPGNEIARVDFYWMGQSSAGLSPELGYLDDVAISDQHYGRLAEVRVIRGAEVAQKVRYVYFDEFADDFSYEQTSGTQLKWIYDATPGDLCEVVISEKVDNDIRLPGAEDDFYDRVYQYRYYGGFEESFLNGLANISFVGEEHQMMSVIYPQQLEFFADHLSQGAISFDSVHDAAIRLRSASYYDFADQYYHDPTQLILPNEHWGTLYDLSSKLISYYPDGNSLEGRVQTQIVNAGDGSSGNCGCGSAPSGFRLGKRFDYLYKRYIWDVTPVDSPSWSHPGSSASDGYSIQVVESSASVNASDELEYIPYRVYTSDYYWPSQSAPGQVGISTGGSIMKIAQVTSEADPSWDYDHLDDEDSETNNINPFLPNGKNWVTMNEYFTDTDPTEEDHTDFRKTARKITPSALDDNYTPSLGLLSAALPTIKPNDGLIYTNGYDKAGGGTSGWKTQTGVQQGDLGSVEIVNSYERQLSGASGREDLPVTINRHRSQTANDFETTSVTYGYRPTGSSYQAVASETREVLIESTDQNGPASQSNPEVTYIYDLKGQIRWVIDESGDLEYRNYDTSNGKLVKVVQDADPGVSYDGTETYTEASLPPSVGPYEELITVYEYDTVGRMSKITDPGGVSAYYRYEYRLSDIYDEATLGMVARGVPFMARVQYPHELTVDSFDGPISVSWQDANGQSIRQSSFIASNGGGQYDPLAGQSAEGAQVERSDSERILSGLVKSQRVWHDLTSNETYVTQYEFDTLGRVLSITDPEGGIVQYGDSNGLGGYDILDRPLVVSQGTVGNSLQEVSKTYYDSPQDATQGIGNGNVTYQETYTGESAGGIRTTKHWYDYRDRLIGTENPEAPHQSMAYDNLNRVIEHANWTDQIFSSGAPDPGVASATRSTYSQALYNNRGLSYRTLAAIDPTNPSTQYLESNRWFDEEGLVIATWSPNSAATKYEYDSLDRLSVQYVTDRVDDAMPGSGSYEDADDISGDHVITQTEYLYLEAGTPGAGGVERMTARSRLHDAPESGGGEVTGALDSTNSIAAFSVYVRDDAGRVIDTLNYGTNDTDFSAGTVAPTAPFDTNRGTSSALISSVGFDDWGRIRVSIDPEGKQAITKYDDLSRAVAVIESAVSLDEDDIAWASSNWSVTWPGGAPADRDRVTTFAYDGLSNVIKRTAHLNDGTTQVTQYDYGTTEGSSSNTMDTLIHSSSLLAAVHYPNEASGQADTSAEYTVSYAYNMLGEIRGMLDQNGTTHSYTRDDLGRVTSDTVTITNTDLDSTIDAIEVSYDGHGRVLDVLSKGSSTIINGVSIEYTPLHQVARIFQNADGDPSASGVESIAYAYDNQDIDDVTGGGNFSRLAQVWYPTEVDVKGITPGMPIPISTTGEETLSMDYSGVINNRISRLNGMDVPGWGTNADDLVRYEYLGRSTPIRTDYPSIDVALDYTKSWDGSDPANSYPGFDQYGRVVWHGWVKDGFSPGTNAGFPDRTPHMARRYEYDAMSNRIKDWDGRPGATTVEVLPQDKDWEYEYDELDRLKTAKRGIRGDYATGLNFKKAEDSQQWALDMLGNWDSITLDTDIDWDFGTNADVNARLHNAANETTSFDVYPESASVLDPSYDPAGNFKLNTSTAGPNALRYVHDAWNRLVRVETNPSSGSPVSVLENEFNGLNWRVKRRVDLTKSSNDGLDEERVYYYSAGWQMIEEEVNTDMLTDEEYTSQQFWGVRYIDDSVAKRIDRDNDQVWTDPDSKYHYLTDVMFSSRAILDHNGQVTERVDYTPYGVASLSYPGDLNNDGNFDFFDVSVSVGSSVVPGDANFDPDVDFDFSGAFDFFDISAFLAAYGLHSNSIVPDGWISDPTDAVPVGATLGFGPDNSVGYDGYMFDVAGATDGSNSGVYCVRNRVYDPGLGKWLERDPLRYRDGTNLFEYVKSIPISYIDPLGTISWPHKNKCAKKLFTDFVQDEIDRFIKENPDDFLCKNTKPSIHRRVLTDIIGNKTMTCLIRAKHIANKDSKTRPRRPKEWGRIPNLEGKNHGPRDAMRHCIATCELARCTGSADFARNYMNAREKCGDKSFTGAEIMDIYNNNQGAAAAADTGKSCKDACWSGSRKTLPRDEWLE